MYCILCLIKSKSKLCLVGSLSRTNVCYYFAGRGILEPLDLTEEVEGK